MRGYHPPKDLPHQHESRMTAPFEILGADRPGRWLIACDHASNRVPPEIGGGTLGLPDAEMQRHIAWDVGAAGLTRHLAAALDSPAILSRFSRLVIDPNRGEDDPTLLMKLYDGTIIPGNRAADAAERAFRRDAFHRPYHVALAELADRRSDTAILSVHSFTPRLRGRTPRPWQIGLLYAGDTRLARGMQDAIAADRVFADWVEAVSGAPLCLGNNQPYAGHLPGDTIDRHALAHGRLNILIELRHDLIATESQQADWASALAPICERALALVA